MEEPDDITKLPSRMSLKHERSIYAAFDEFGHLANSVQHKSRWLPRSTKAHQHDESMRFLFTHLLIFVHFWSLVLAVYLFLSMLLECGRVVNTYNLLIFIIFISSVALLECHFSLYMPHHHDNSATVDEFTRS